MDGAADAVESGCTAAEANNNNNNSDDIHNNNKTHYKKLVTHNHMRAQ